MWSLPWGAALLRTIVHCRDEGAEEVHREVAARFDMARPALSELVESGRMGIEAKPSGAQKVQRNFGLHAELGCGVDALPKTTAEAKSRCRGGKHITPPRHEDKKSDQGQQKDSISDLLAKVGGLELLYQQLEAKLACFGAEIEQQQAMAKAKQEEHEKAQAVLELQAKTEQEAV